MASHSNIHIRLAQPQDAAGIRRLIVETIDRCYPAAYGPEAVQHFKDHHREEAIRQRIVERQTLVLEQAGQLRGTGSVEEGYVKGLFVDPEAQGRGYGRSLMERLETMARSAGVEEFSLCASTVSVDFYLGLGYTIVRENHVDLGRGARLDFCEMTKRAPWPEDQRGSGVMGEVEDGITSIHRDSRGVGIYRAKIRRGRGEPGCGGLCP